MGAPIRVGLRSLTVTSESGAVAPIQFDTVEATVRVKSTQREPLQAATGLAGFAESDLPPFIEWGAYLRDGVDYSALVRATDLKVVAVTKGGKSYVISRGWLAQDPERNLTSGQATFRVDAYEGEEVVPG